MEVNNYTDWTKEEHFENLKRLNINTYSDLIGKSVYYVKPLYGLHTVIKWNPDTVEFLLDLEGSRFWSNPFRISLSE